MDLPKNVRLNPNAKVVERLQEVMKNNGGYCPCRIQRTEESKCICDEFKKQIADENFTGFCHCQLYFKEK